MLDHIAKAIDRQAVTVLFTHWWEYFRNDIPNAPFIKFLHDTATYLASRSDVRVISFSELAKNRPALN